jgi:hypothetical protein
MPVTLLKLISFNKNAVAVVHSTKSPIFSIQLPDRVLVNCPKPTKRAAKRKMDNKKA